MTAANNAKWVSIGQAVRICSQLASLLILARFLPPSDYGLMAMATVVTNLALLLRDMGTAAAVIQKDQLKDETTAAVFWLNIAMGLLLAIILFLSSSVVANYFNSPELAEVLCALAVIFPITSSTALHQALLERKSAFRTLARIDTVSALIGLLIAIAAAWLGAGVYSLVLQAVATAVLSSSQLWVASDWRPKSGWSLAELRGIIGFSSYMSGYQLISYLFRNADGMVIGKYLGTGALGIYSLAYKLMLFPVQNITWVAARALYPVMSRQQNNVDQMRLLYLRSVSFISFISAPLMVGMFVLREPFVLVAFGSSWSAVADILFWLAPVGYLQSVIGTTGPVFMALGKTKILFKLAIFGTALHVGAFLFGSRSGVTGVAAFYLLASTINTLPTLYFVLKLLNLKIMFMVKELFLPVLFSLVMGVVIHFILLPLKSYTGIEAVKLVSISLIGAIIYLLLWLIFYRKKVKIIFSYTRSSAMA